jgi:hypothetical protein
METSYVLSLPGLKYRERVLSKKAHKIKMIDEQKIRRKSPNFPSLSLSRALELAERVYESALDSALDTGTVLELMGFKGISGASRTALATLKQFGLLEGRDNDNRVTKLASRIFHPLTDEEKVSAIVEASRKPPIYDEIFKQFKGSIPDDKVLKAFLIRNNGFSDSGSSSLIKGLRDTENFTAPFRSKLKDYVAELEQDTASLRGGDIIPSQPTAVEETRDKPSEVLKFRLTPDSNATITLDGHINQRSILRLISILELARDSYPEN